MPASAQPLVPSPGQLAWQRAGLGVFFHVGLNTFHGLEWSDGTLDPATFAPDALDTDQWVRTAQDAGAEYVVLTAKHHDGFCLWPTTTTDYSVAASPWRDGRGDLVGELAASCRRHGMRLGLYLSPWDRNADCYPDAAAYDEFYLTQLRELCTNYGELYELWFDGAGSQGRSYDWTRIAALIDELQPQAMVFNMGRPTIRWVGNEDGLAADPVRYVVAQTKLDNYTTSSIDFAEQYYLPPECDVSIRRGWFFQPEQQPKSLEHLLAIYYRSIGLGANLLLNLPPDRHGLLPAEDVARVEEWRAELNRRFADPLPATLTHADDGTVRLDFGREVELDHLLLAEDLTAGQRAGEHQVRTPDGRAVATGGSIGVRRLHVFPAVTTSTLTVDVGTSGAVLSGATGFRAGHEQAPQLPENYRASTDTPD